jgi:hypothetical protein
MRFALLVVVTQPIAVIVLVELPHGVMIVTSMSGMMTCVHLMMITFATMVISLTLYFMG